MLRVTLSHPGPDQPLGGTPVAWLHSVGYPTARFGATMVRPTLDDIPDLTLPEGVEVRPVAEE